MRGTRSQPSPRRRPRTWRPRRPTERRSAAPSGPSSPPAASGSPERVTPPRSPAAPPPCSRPSTRRRRRSAALRARHRPRHPRRRRPTCSSFTARSTPTRSSCSTSRPTSAAAPSRRCGPAAATATPRAIELVRAANPDTPTPAFLRTSLPVTLHCALAPDDVDAAVDLLAPEYWNDVHPRAASPAPSPAPTPSSAPASTASSSPARAPSPTAQVRLGLRRRRRAAVARRRPRAGSHASVPRSPARPQRRARAPTDPRRAAALPQARLHRGGRSSSPSVPQHGYAAHPEVNMALTLYIDSFSISPYAFSAYVALEEKGVAYDWKTVSLPDKAHQRADYRPVDDRPRAGHQPRRLLARRVGRDFVNYLDEAFPAPQYKRALPENIRDRARARMIMDWIRSDLMRDSRRAPDAHDVLQARRGAALRRRTGVRWRGSTKRRRDWSPTAPRRCLAPGARPTATWPSCCTA